METIIVAFDDTDSLDKSLPGTGELLERFIEESQFASFPKRGFISRHQLLIHPDIPYTSHNSAMAVELFCNNLSSLIEEAGLFLSNFSASGSDPGLCVIQKKSLSKLDKQQLIEFGFMAKESLISRNQAYEFAHSIDAIHLSAHGGSEDGVIGALAGSGLRLSGNDGRVKGKMKLETTSGLTTVANILEATVADRVFEWKNEQLIAVALPENAVVEIDSAVKTVIFQGEKVVPVIRLDKNRYKGVHRKNLKGF